jgi:hypothetical protein
MLLLRFLLLLNFDSFGWQLTEESEVEIRSAKGHENSKVIFIRFF